MHGEICGLCRFWTACDLDSEEPIGICREGSPAYHEGLGYIFPVTPSVESCGRFEARETEELTESRPGITKEPHGESVD